MPSNLQSFLLLLVLIAPGFLFTQASAYGRPRYYKEPDLFRQTVSTLIASTVIHTLLLLFLGGVAFTILRMLWPDLSVRDLLKPLLDYSVHELVGYSIILAGYSAASLFLVRREKVARPSTLVIIERHPVAQPYRSTVDRGPCLMFEIVFPVEHLFVISCTEPEVV